MQLAVIIPYYNGHMFIERCVESLDSYPHVYIVDNSDDPIPSLENVHITKTTKTKIGFGAAVNVGFNKVLQFDYTHILVLNQDAYFKEGHFLKLLDFLNQNPPDKFASPQIYTEDFEEVMPFLVHRYFNDGLPQNIRDIESFVAVAMIIPIDLMLKLNGFDENFYMYYEDTDLIARSNIHKPVRILPFIHVAHHNPDLLARPLNPEKERWIREGRIKYLARHGNRLEWIYYYLKNLLFNK